MKPIHCFRCVFASAWVGRGGEVWWVAPAECPVLLHARHSSDTLCNAESLVCVPRPADNSWWVSKWWRLFVESTATFGAERHVIESIYSRNKCLHKQDWGEWHPSLISLVLSSPADAHLGLTSLPCSQSQPLCPVSGFHWSNQQADPGRLGCLPGTFFLVGCHCPVLPPLHIKLLGWQYN